MAKIHSAFLLCLFFAFCSCSKDNNLTLHDGDYLSEFYIESLKRTRSPKAASDETKHYEWVTVTNNTSNTHLSFFESFHSPALYLELNKHGEITRNSSEQIEKVQLAKNNSFVVIYLSQDITYSFASSLDRFINENSIAGTYVDASGKIYTFEANGNAIFPEYSFRYTVARDFVVCPCRDLIYKEQNSKNPPSALNEIFWKFDGDKLLLFNPDYNIIGISEPEPQPFVVLSPKLMNPNTE